MPNLLTEERKMNIFYEFLWRLSVVFLSFSFFTICVATVLLVPSHLLSLVKESEVADKVGLYKQSIVFREGNVSADILKDEQLKLDALQQQEDEMEVGQLIEKIINNKPGDIRINGFFYEKVIGVTRGRRSRAVKEDDKLQLVVRGVADDRSSLINFINRLKLEDKFLKVDFPVANLTKGERVDFSINIILAIIK